MTTVGQYWAVGQSTSSPLALTASELAGYLVSDWVSNIPSVTATDLMGWPQYLLTVAGLTNELTLVPELRNCERQWKGFVSWMLGVASARKILDEEGYQWIAPVSAFYPNKVVPVSTHGWHPSYPSSRLRVATDPRNTSKLRPDYIALRPATSGGSFNWALAEAKGTNRSLKSMTTAPRPWSDQVRNAKVSMVTSGATAATPVHISRHIVIATRVSPNASRDTTRRLQIRAWNSEKTVLNRDTNTVEFEVIAAHLHGFCQNLGLYKNADAIALATRLRTGPSQTTAADIFTILRDEAAEELYSRMEIYTRRPDYQNQRPPMRVKLPERRDRRGVTNATVTVEAATLDLLGLVQKTYAVDSIDMVRVHALSRELEDSYLERSNERGANDSMQRDGITVSMQTTND
ncbi:hypothetical protein [Burkholderia sp. BCC1644]|uniref:hypothetical protein n=1 Tax=Burkholderia sp. BCC1644 TaxID=2676293 RepID=UPI0015927D69|nr:hypothetical protein [Burkholderia sp. BCC1644]